MPTPGEHKTFQARILTCTKTTGRKEEDKLSRIADHAELKKNDYNISPSRYIHISNAKPFCQ